MSKNSIRFDVLKLVVAGSRHIGPKTSSKDERMLRAHPEFAETIETTHTFVGRASLSDSRVMLEIELLRSGTAPGSAMGEARSGN